MSSFSGDTSRKPATAAEAEDDSAPGLPVTLPIGSISVLAVALLALLLAIVAQVVFTASNVNPVVRFSNELPFLGDAITLNSLLDFQWHVLVVIGLLPASLVWLRDGHVRVDFLYSARSLRTRARIDLIGNLVFAAPFLTFAIPAALDFTSRAWRSDEGSANAGLNDLWAIKSVLPVGLGLLAFAVGWESVRLVRALR